MLKFTPFLLAIGYALVLYQFSVWRTRRTLDRNSTELADPILRVMTDRMAEVLGVAHVPVHIYEVDPVNGLAAPDGRIFLTRGFYRRYRAGDVTAAELASVIAHELGHVALGHTRRRMIDFTGQNALFVSLAALFGRVIPVIGPFVAAAAARLVTTLLAARLSRADEFEADAWAAALLTRAGIGTAPQKALFAKLGALTGGGAPDAPAWLLSHPRTAERIAAIEALEARWQGSMTRD